MFVERMARLIDGARTITRLDWASGRIWQAYGAGEADDQLTQSLADRIAARKAELRSGPKTVGQIARPASIFPPRKRQVSPDRRASLMRRRRMASSGPLPPALAAHFTVGQLAVMRIISDETRDRGRCAVTIAEIAARAGVCRALVQQALHVAADLGLLIVQERRRQGQKNLPNLVRLVSVEWLAWIKRGPKASPIALRPDSIGSKLLGPTNTTIKKLFDNKREKDCGAYPDTSQLAYVSYRDTLQSQRRAGR